MTLLEHLADRRLHRRLRHEFLVAHGLDNRSILRLVLERIDPKFFIAFTIIGLFAWAFATSGDNETRQLMVGALIAAFAGAWGYYLGSSATAHQANDRADRTLELNREMIRDRHDPADPRIELEPGQTATVAGAAARPEGERGTSGFTFTRMGAKLVRRGGYFGTTEEPIPTIGHWCPACAEVHDFAVDRPFRNGHRWAFDGNLEAPTFSPSMNISWGPDSRGKVGRCHYILSGGQIRYCGDCTHGMAGQVVDLPDLPPEATRWADEILEGER